MQALEASPRIFVLGGGSGGGKTSLLANWVQQDLTPDLTLLLDIPIEQGLQRAKQRSAPDRFEAETSDFFTQVRAEYLRLAACDPNRVTRVDATRSLSQVQQHIQQAIQRLLPYDH